MNTLNTEIENILLEKGALKVGFVTRESMSGGPPSADITYHMPDTQSAVSFALPLDRKKIRSFLRKDLPNGRIEHEEDNIETNIKAFRIAYEAAKLLKEKGFKANPVFPNYRYRRDVTGWQVKLYPEISLRYLALRSGVGAAGWSGNIGIKDFGAPIILGALTTSANLDPTAPKQPEESFCTQCKLCEQVCPLRMFDREEAESISLGGYTFRFSKRINLMRCYISCSGFSGLDKTNKWSTWSPGRYLYPKSDKEVVDVLSHSYITNSKWSIKGENRGFNIKKLKNDSDFKKVFASNKNTLKLIKNTKLTCGNCQLICWGDPKETAENYRLLTGSGCVIKNNNRTIDILSAEEAQKRLDTSAGVAGPGPVKRILIRIANRYLAQFMEYCTKRPIIQ